MTLTRRTRRIIAVIGTVSFCVGIAFTPLPPYAIGVASFGVGVFAATWSENGS